MEILIPKNTREGIGGYIISATEARGKNGWFTPQRIAVTNIGGVTTISIYSRRMALMAPIVFADSTPAMTKTLEQILEELKS